MIYSAKRAVLLIVALLGMTSWVAAQTGYRPKNEMGEERFEIDAVDFRSDQTGINSLDIYYKIFYDALSYQKTDTGYVASYEVAIVIEGQGDTQLEGITRQGHIKVDNYAESRRSTDFIINAIHTKYPDQDITVRAILTDKLAGTSMEEKKDLKKRDYWGKYPDISRIEFAREVEPALGDSRFNKGDYRVIPNVSRLFGGDQDTLLDYYQEVYPGQKENKYISVVSRIYHRAKGIIYADTMKIGDLDSVRHLVRQIDITDISPGLYDLEIRVEGRRGKQLSNLIEPFELELTAETIFRNDYETAVKMLKYLATSDENKKLEEAKTPEARRTAWDEFWRLRDDDPHDQVNPTKQEYFRRIRHANRNFTLMKREGWRTDRGRVYITFGEPDEVDDYPFELSSKPYQIWYYYRINPARQFLFIDEWGDGNFELQPPYDGVY